MQGAWLSSVETKPGVKGDMVRVLLLKLHHEVTRARLPKGAASGGAIEPVTRERTVIVASKGSEPPFAYRWQGLPLAASGQS